MVEECPGVKVGTCRCQQEGRCSCHWRKFCVGTCVEEAVFEKSRKTNSVLELRRSGQESTKGSKRGV